HSITVGYLGDTRIQEVNINPGKLANPSGKQDTIVINGAPVSNPLTVVREDVIIFPAADPHGDGTHGGTTTVTGLGHSPLSRSYKVRAANLNDKVTVNTGDGDDTVNVQGITGPTWINTGTGNHTVTVGKPLSPSASTLVDLLGPLTIRGKGNNVVLTINDQGTAT